MPSLRGLGSLLSFSGTSVPGSGMFRVGGRKGGVNCFAIIFPEGRPDLFAERQSVGNIGEKVEDHCQNKIGGQQLHPFEPIGFSVRGDLTCN